MQGTTIFQKESRWEAEDIENSVLPYTQSFRNFAKIVMSLNTKDANLTFKQLKLEQDVKGLNVLDLLNNSKNCMKIT
jgi:phage terminase large subunit